MNEEIERWEGGMGAGAGLPVGSVAMVRDSSSFPHPYQRLPSGHWFHGSERYSDERMAIFIEEGRAEVVYRAPDPNEGLAELLWEGAGGRVEGFDFADAAHVTRVRYLTLARDVRDYIKKEGK